MYNKKENSLLVGMLLTLSACGGGDPETGVTEGAVTTVDSIPQVGDQLPEIGAAMELAEADGSVIVDENAKTRFCSADGDVEDEHAGFTGSGFVNSENRTGASIVWELQVEQATEVGVSVRYASGSDGSRSARLTANGAVGTSMVYSFLSSGSWDSWEEETHSLVLSPGLNSVELVALTDAGLPNVDFIQIHSDHVAVVACADANQGVAVGPDLGSGGVGSAEPAVGEVPPEPAPDNPQVEEIGNEVQEGLASPDVGVPPEEGEVVGWASVSYCGANGTTGGGGAPVVTVTTADALISELTSSGPKVVAVEGSIAGVGAIKNISDKTLIGVNGATISGGIRFTSARNVIVRDIDFANGSNDTFELSSSECIWFDHNNFRDGRDGNLDIVRGSNYVTVSWSRFFYTESHDHMLSNLNGNTNDFPTDEGKIKVTFHHNWWGAGVQERMPRVRYGQTHVFNNYYKYEPIPGDGGQNYVIGAGQYSQLLVENNYFDGSRNPIVYISESGTAEVVQSGNAFVNTSGKVVERGNAFVPPYSYVLDSADDVRDLVMAGAGPR